MKGDILLFIAILIAVFFPSLPIVGNPENLASLIMLIFLMIFASASTMNSLFISVVVMMLLLSISTLVGIVIASGESQYNINSVGVYFRLIICVYAIKSASDIMIIRRGLLLVGAGTSLFAIMQFFSTAITNITIKYYLSPERAAVFDYSKLNDEIVRVISFFENPSSVGLISVVLIIFGIRELSCGRLSRNAAILYVSINLLAGILSLSKIFFIGLALILLQLLILNTRFGMYALLIVIFVAILIFLVVDTNSPIFELIQYSANASINPGVALEGRYLDQQVETLMASKYFGYGVVVVDHVNINDSLYMGIIYTMGIIGALLVMGGITIWIFLNRKMISIETMLTLLIIAIAGIGTNSIMGYRLDIFLTALLITSIFASKKNTKC